LKQCPELAGIQFKISTIFEAARTE